MKICNGLGSDGNWLVSPRMAAEYKRSRPIEESDCYPQGITGQQYFPNSHANLVYPVTFVELVPEPTNEHDPNAIYVRAQGHKIGYVPANRAAHLHSTIALMRHEGIGCLVPLTTPEEYDFDDDNDDEYDFDDDDDDYFHNNGAFKKKSHIPQLGVMLLPTHQTLNQLCPLDVLFREFDRALETLGDAFIDELNRSKWRFNVETYPKFRSAVGRNMRYPFSNDLDKYDALLWRYLVNYRRLIYRAEEKRKFNERNISIVKSHRSGESVVDIAERHKLSPETIRDWIRRGKKEEEKWKHDLKSTPASFEDIRDQILVEKFQITPETEANRKKWLSRQRELDNKFEKKQAPASTPLSAQDNRQPSPLPRSTVHNYIDASEKSQEPIVHQRSSTASNKQRRGIRGALARFFGID